MARIGSNRGRLDRISPLDASNLRVEDRGLPMHIAALAILDGPIPGCEPGQTELDVLRRAVERRLHLAPRLRQLLYRPGTGLGPPVWVDDADFDIRRHVHSRSVPAPGDEAALLAVCSELNAARLDPSSPLWELWLLTGLASGRRAVLIRLHHVVADGIAALGMLGVLLDSGPDTAVGRAPGWVPAPVPAVLELAADRFRRLLSALGRAADGLRRPSLVLARCAVLGQLAGRLAHEGRAPRTSLNVPVTGSSRVILIRADLERARTVAHAHGGTVNDVILAAVAGGARRVLLGRGEFQPDLVLKASVAASVRSPSSQQGAGNRVGIIIVPLPAGESDPARCLTRVAAATRERKKLPPYQPNGRLAQRWMLRTMQRQRLVNVLVSNLPGPAAPLQVAGQRVAELFQIGVVQGNLTVSVGALSYAGRLNLDLVGDHGAIPDLAVFAAGMSETLGLLGVLAGAGPGAQ